MHYSKIIKGHTSNKWIKNALENIRLILIDHAQCEKKAAQSALSLISKFKEPKAIDQLSRLVREEMLHFEQVLKIIDQFGYSFEPIKPSGYGAYLMSCITTDNAKRLRDQLIIAAIIEARSCERMGLLADSINDTKLQNFYQTLYKAEMRHAAFYLELAVDVCNYDIEHRLTELSDLEFNWLERDYMLPRFHSSHGG